MGTRAGAGRSSRCKRLQPAVKGTKAAAEASAAVAAEVSAPLCGARVGGGVWGLLMSSSQLSLISQLATRLLRRALSLPACIPDLCFCERPAPARRPGWAEHQPESNCTSQDLCTTSARAQAAPLQGAAAGGAGTVSVVALSHFPHRLSVQGPSGYFQIPFPAPTAINSKPQGLPTEQIALSSIHHHGYGTAAAVPTLPCPALGSSEVSEEERQVGTASAHMN